MDAVAGKVKLLVGREAVRAHGLPGHLRPNQPPDPPVCRYCRGDGCPHCDYTGDAN